MRLLVGALFAFALPLSADTPPVLTGFDIQFVEEFSAAFKSGAQNSVRNSENVAPSIEKDDKPGGKNMARTKIAIRFVNVPRGVWVFAPHVLSQGSVRALRVGASISVGGEVSIQNGNGVVMYEVVTANPGMLENVTVPVKVLYQEPAPLYFPFIANRGGFDTGIAINSVFVECCKLGISVETEDGIRADMIFDRESR